jgi:hypothetical protein
MEIDRAGNGPTCSELDIVKADYAYSKARRARNGQCANQKLVKKSARTPTDPALESRLRKIPEFGDRVLRVVLNTQVVPVRVVSVYFDRTMKGKL